MPLGFERINARVAQPNPNINFIKPLEGPDKEYSLDFLKRLAAICNPIMKKNQIAVMSLEEFPPNREFWGRNFNGGEVIQLVLKAPSTGHWLSFKFVQMVLMHELAHCKQMNHSRAFWKVRNDYSVDLRALWDKGYTGEGMWSKGATLASGQIERQSVGNGEIQPEHLCGGIFSSSGKRKRKIKPKVSYKERQERRIARKFGVNGIALGADEETKTKLEKGKRPVGKPRVAGSARGRELRAAAALARFEVKKEDSDPVDEAEETQSETESEDGSLAKPDEAADINGNKLLDGQGRGLVRVCEDEDKDDLDAQNELAELQGFRGNNEKIRLRDSKPVTLANLAMCKEETLDKKPTFLNKDGETAFVGIDVAIKIPRKKLTSVIAPSAEFFPACPICSMENSLTASTCIACAHVLDPAMISGAWTCKSETCKNGKYLNAGDCGICGVCGARKCS